MSSGKTVVFVNHNAGSPIYGPNLRTYYAAKHLVLQGYSVHVFSGSFSHKYMTMPKTSGKVTCENIDGINYYWIKTIKYNSLITRIISFHQFSSMLYRAVIENVRSMQAIICSSPPPVSVKICYKLARKYNARFIFDVRDLWPLTILEMNPLSKFNPYVVYIGHLEKYAYTHCDCVVSALPCAENYMIDNGLPNDRFISVENGTEISESYPVSEHDLPVDTREALTSNKQFVVGYAGAFDRDNDLETLIDAAALLRNQDIEFVLVGKGEGRKRLAAKASGLSNVFIVSPVRSDQVPWVLARFDACYMGLKAKSIFQYGVSMNKIFEYMRASRPIISAIDAGNDIVSDSGCGMTVSSEDPQAVADAVKNIANMASQERRTLGQRGLAYLEKNHTYDVLVNGWIRAIEGS